MTCGDIGGGHFRKLAGQLSGAHRPILGAIVDGVRDVLLYVTLVINVVSLFSLIGGILLHSGRGGGLSDMFGGGGGAALGSTAAERNLNRITFVLALVWIFSLLAFSFFLDGA